MAGTVTTASSEVNASQSEVSKVAERPVCGIVRPIAEMGDYSAAHWEAVHAIVGEAANAIGFDTRLVSESDSVGIILNHIVTNLYTAPIVICDVSGRNPNVMFELGMRVAFEKPVVIIVDDSTPFSFDISPLRHLPYPRSLRYADMVAFKTTLGNAIESTLAVSKEPGYRGYLQQFGPIEVTKLSAQQVSAESVVSDLAELKRSFVSLESAIRGKQYTQSIASDKQKYKSDFIFRVDDRNADRLIADFEESGHFKVAIFVRRVSDDQRLGIDVNKRFSVPVLAGSLARIFTRGWITETQALSRVAIDVAEAANVPITSYAYPDPQIVSAV